MAVVSIKNFPDGLLAELSDRAAQNGRVVDDEIIEAAKKHLSGISDVLTAAQKLAIADAVRASTPGAWTDDDLIRRARDEGRA